MLSWVSSSTCWDESTHVQVEPSHVMPTFEWARWDPCRVILSRT